MDYPARDQQTFAGIKLDATTGLRVRVAKQGDVALLEKPRFKICHVVGGWLPDVENFATLKSKNKMSEI